MESAMRQGIQHPFNCARALCYLPRNERRCPLTLGLRLVPASPRTSPSLDLSTLGDELLRFRLGQIEFHYCGRPQR